MASYTRGVGITPSTAHQASMKESTKASGGQLFGQVGRLGEQEQVVGAQGYVGTHGLPHVVRRHDVEDGQVADGFGLLERQTLADEPAAVVAPPAKPSKPRSRPGAGSRRA